MLLASFFTSKNPFSPDLKIHEMRKNPTKYTLFGKLFVSPQKTGVTQQTEALLISYRYF
jgi:hypothetical protein